MSRRDTAASDAAAARAPAFRRDIQGLRAVAVLGVVGDHVVHWPKGGFVGVDVFFVISGFLITGLLLREVDRSGGISFTRFYARRVKRILPLAALTLAVTAAATALVFNAARAGATATDALWAAFFAANVHFEAVQTDYFQNQGPVSPLQHFWSLSVEEQFYFVWPAILVVVVILVWRLGVRSPRPALTAVLGLGIGISFAAAVVLTAGDPQGAYFSTGTRAWELGVGALLAVAAPTLSRVSQKIRPTLQWGGLLGILACYFLIDQTLPFPGPWAALPVAAAALVILSGIGSARPIPCAPLTNPLSRYLGDTSYALYLWHFPVQVILLDQLGATWFRAPVTLLVSFALAISSHHLIETPLIRSPWLIGGLSANERRRRWVRWRHDEGPAMGRAALGALGFATAILVAVALAPTTTPTTPLAALAALPTAEASASPGPTATAGASAPGPATAVLQTEVRSALESTSWPQLDPSIESVLDGSRPGSPSLKCGSADTNGLPQSECTWGSPRPSKRAVLVGDSTAMHYLDALIALAETEGSGWSLSNRAMFACPFVDVRVRNDTKGIVDACQKHNAATLSYLDEQKPDLVIVTNSYQRFDDDDTGTTVTSAAWSKGITSYLDRVAKTGAQIVSLAPPPDDKDIAACYRPGSVPADCVSRTPKTWFTRLAGDTRDFAVHGGTVIDPRPWLCVSDLCPAFVAATPVKEDRVHLTTAFALKLVPALGETMAAKGYFVASSP